MAQGVRRGKTENGVKVLEVDCRAAEHLKLAIAGGAPTDSGDEEQMPQELVGYRVPAPENAANARKPVGFPRDEPDAAPEQLVGSSGSGALSR